jgi:hypothetical protein
MLAAIDGAYTLFIVASAAGLGVSDGLLLALVASDLFVVLSGMFQF